MSDRRLYPSAALHGQVAHDIGRKIVSGAIAQGDFLPHEAELSEQFQVSRQAVREALKVLAAKGLVASRRRAGTYVMPRETWNLLDPDVIAWHPPAELSPDFLADLVELRRLIEPAAARFAATRGTPERIEGIGIALDKMRRTVGDPHAFFAADAEFHVAMCAASGNTLIDRLSFVLAPLYEASFRIQQEAGPTHQALIPVHEAVYDAIRTGDSAGAGRAIETILEAAATAATQVAIDRMEKPH
ncbi:MAG TPA: FadR/GntR family transcriptional regulator [Bauldia sp.]|nr:FadR/GntR family transcriptional regulator [Bauldia sp.]